MGDTPGTEFGGMDSSHPANVCIYTRNFVDTPASLPIITGNEQRVEAVGLEFAGPNRPEVAVEARASHAENPIHGTEDHAEEFFRERSLFLLTYMPNMDRNPHLENAPDHFVPFTGNALDTLYIHPRIECQLPMGSFEPQNQAVIAPFHYRPIPLPDPGLAQSYQDNAYPPQTHNFHDNEPGDPFSCFQLREDPGGNVPSQSDDGNFIIDLDNYEKGKALEKFTMLQDMFPDAETVFLEAKCSEYALHNEAFEFFVENMMVPGDYPKKAIPNLREPNNNDTENDSTFKKFELEAFLKKYPDPVKHFSANGHGFRYIQHSCNYLQMRYKFISAVIIRNSLQKSNYNLYLCDLLLRKSRSSRKIARRPNEVKNICGTPPDDFFEMISFIENEGKIMQFLNDRTLARNKAVEEARCANALLICGCCFADDLLTEEVSNCTEGHIFCKDCILRSSEVNMGNGKIDFPCLQDCTGYFELLVLKDILPETSYGKLEKKLQEREIVAANISGLESCPFCEYCAIPPEGDRIFECENCHKQSCRLCRKVSHIPLKCEEVEDDRTKERTFVEEKMSEALVRICWKCGTKFIREDGCNKMTCICGAVMCYICRAPIKGYNHFYESNYPNHPVPLNRCPLWTNNTKLHKQEVNLERDKAIEALKRKNPNFDSAMLLNKKSRSCTD